MNGASDSETAAKPQGERLTLRQSRNALLKALGLILLFAPLGFCSMRQGQKMQAALFCYLTVIQLLNLRLLWRQHRLIQQGVTVYATPQVVLSVPRPISTVVTSILTGLVGIFSVFGIFIAYSRFNTFIRWAIADAILLPLWMYTGYCWYRITTERRKVPVVEPVYEQREGVWPPAPRISENEDAQVYREPYTYQTLTKLVTRGTLTYRTNIRRNAHENLTHP